MANHICIICGAQGEVGKTLASHAFTCDNCFDKGECATMWPADIARKHLRLIAVKDAEIAQLKAEIIHVHKSYDPFFTKP